MRYLLELLLIVSEWCRRNVTNTGQARDLSATSVLWWIRLQSTTCPSTYCESSRWQMREMAAHAPLGSSSSLTGLSKGCLSLGMGSLTSLGKSTRPRSSLDRTVLSLCIAGEINTSYLQYFFKFLIRLFVCRWVTKQLLEFFNQY